MTESKNTETPKTRGWSAWSVVRKGQIIGAAAGALLTVGAWAFTALYPSHRLFDLGSDVLMLSCLPAVLILSTLSGQSKNWSVLNAFPGFLGIALVFSVNSVLGFIAGSLVGGFINAAKSGRPKRQ
jgi:hypothetical protein